jgi:AcrR family transcriptional regulator
MGGRHAQVVDRRISRTRAALFDALISLILRKGYDATTVQDIIDEANVGRSTFYAHCTGKDDLLRRSFQKLRALLAGARRGAVSGSRDGTLSFSRALFEHACDQSHVYGALAGGRGGVVAAGEMRRLLADLVREDIPAGHDELVPRELVVQFVVATFLTVLSWCLDRKPKLRPQQIDVIFRRLVISGIGSLNL